MANSEPTSDNTAPYSFAKLRNVVCMLDNSFFGLGEAWSINRIVLSGLLSLSFPSF